ncbi:hypothetical protein BPJM79_120021 [Bacillus pumilus]
MRGKQNVCGMPFLFNLTIVEKHEFLYNLKAKVALLFFVN